MYNTYTKYVDDDDDDAWLTIEFDSDIRFKRTVVRD